MTIFSMQSASIPITSSLPEYLDRIIDPEHPDWHFCCNLNYMTLKGNEDQNLKAWSNAKTVVIDFTTGILMNATRYVAEITHQDQGIYYGLLDQTQLEQTWKSLGSNRK